MERDEVVATELTQRSPQFEAAVRLATEVMAGEAYDRSQRRIPAGTVLSLSRKTAFPGKARLDGQPASHRVFWTGFAYSDSAIFHPDNVAELRLRDNETTRLYFAGAQLDTLPFPIVWVREPAPLFPEIQPARHFPLLNPRSAVRRSVKRPSTTEKRLDTLPVAVQDEIRQRRSTRKRPFAQPKPIKHDESPLFNVNDVDEEPFTD